MGFGFRGVNENLVEDPADAYQWDLEECESCANSKKSFCDYYNTGIPGKCEYFDLKGINSDSLCELLVARVD